VRILLGLLTFALVAVVPGIHAAPEVDPDETVIRLTIQPMAAPRPALKYLLLPELKEMFPGNPVPAYLQCLASQDYAEGKETFTPAALRQADRAARLDKPDWQVLLKTKADGFALSVTDVQKMRTLANGLHDRFRTEVEQGRLDDALFTAKTMFALSRHAAEHPTMAGNLAAIAIALRAIGPLEETLERPGCPNLYWALTNLPAPFVSLEKGLEGERLFIETEFRGLSDSTPMTPEQLNTFMDHVDNLKAMAVAGQPPRSKIKTRETVAPRAADAGRVVAARGRLVKNGLSEKLLLKFPSEQVVLLDDLRELTVRRDEVIKLMKLPVRQFQDLLNKNEKLKEETLLGNLGAKFESIRIWQGRLEQRFGLLRHVEAIRLYAADHKGALPAKLTDCTVPLPNDPMTDKPFRYEVKDGVAHLRSSPPAGREIPAVYNLHYEIRVGSRQWAVKTVVRDQKSEVGLRPEGPLLSAQAVRPGKRERELISSL
jgi:hypothetical protein